MFAKLLQFRVNGRARTRHLGVMSRPCNDNHPIPRLIVSPQRRSKPVLACHWHKGATGRLECAWRSEMNGVMLGEEPQIFFGGRTAAVTCRLTEKL